MNILDQICWVRYIILAICELRSAIRCCASDLRRSAHRVECWVCFPLFVRVEPIPVGIVDQLLVRSNRYCAGQRHTTHFTEWWAWLTSEIDRSAVSYWSTDGATLDLTANLSCIIHTCSCSDKTVSRVPMKQHISFIASTTTWREKSHLK